MTFKDRTGTPETPYLVSTSRTALAEAPKSQTNLKGRIYGVNPPYSQNVPAMEESAPSPITEADPTFEECLRNERFLIRASRFAPIIKAEEKEILSPNSNLSRLTVPLCLSPRSAQNMGFTRPQPLARSWENNSTATLTDSYISDGSDLNLADMKRKRAAMYKGQLEISVPPLSAVGLSQQLYTPPPPQRRKILGLAGYTQNKRPPPPVTPSISLTPSGSGSGSPTATETEFSVSQTSLFSPPLSSPYLVPLNTPNKSKPRQRNRHARNRSFNSPLASPSLCLSAGTELLDEKRRSAVQNLSSTADLLDTTRQHFTDGIRKSVEKVKALDLHLPVWKKEDYLDEDESFYCRGEIKWMSQEYQDSVAAESAAGSSTDLLRPLQGPTLDDLPTPTETVYSTTTSTLARQRRLSGSLMIECRYCGRKGLEESGLCSVCGNSRPKTAPGKASSSMLSVLVETTITERAGSESGESERKNKRISDWSQLLAEVERRKMTPIPESRRPTPKPFQQNMMSFGDRMAQREKATSPPRIYAAPPPKIIADMQHELVKDSFELCPPPLKVRKPSRELSPDVVSPVELEQALQDILMARKPLPPLPLRTNSNSSDFHEIRRRKRVSSKTSRRIRNGPQPHIVEVMRAPIHESQEALVGNTIGFRPSFPFPSTDSFRAEVNELIGPPSEVLRRKPVPRRQFDGSLSSASASDDEVEVDIWRQVVGVSAPSSPSTTNLPRKDSTTIPMTQSPRIKTMHSNKRKHSLDIRPAMSRFHPSNSTSPISPCNRRMKENVGAEILLRTKSIKNEIDLHVEETTEKRRERDSKFLAWRKTTPAFSVACKNSPDAALLHELLLQEVAKNEREDEDESARSPDAPLVELIAITPRIQDIVMGSRSIASSDTASCRDGSTKSTKSTSAGPKTPEEQECMMYDSRTCGSSAGGSNATQMQKGESMVSYLARMNDKHESFCQRMMRRDRERLHL